MTYVLVAAEPGVMELELEGVARARLPRRLVVASGTRLEAGGLSLEFGGGEGGFLLDAGRVKNVLFKGGP